jgi:hypothetical protein
MKNRKRQAHVSCKNSEPEDSLPKDTGAKLLTNGEEPAQEAADPVAQSDSRAVSLPDEPETNLPDVTQTPVNDEELAQEAVNRSIARSNLRATPSSIIAATLHAAGGVNGVIAIILDYCSNEVSCVSSLWSSLQFAGSFMTL